MSSESFFGDAGTCVLSQLRIVREHTSKIRDLRGFRKGHSVPAEVNERAAAFVAKIAAAEIDLELESRFTEFRTRYGLRRSQLTFSDAENGNGLIQTPWFSYQIHVTQSADDPTMVQWRRLLCEIKSPDEILSAVTASVFANSFDRVEFCPQQPVCVSALIDFLEENQRPDLTLDYDRHATHCRISLRPFSASLHVTSECLAFTTSQPTAPGRLLQAFNQLYSQVAGIELRLRP